MVIVAKHMPKKNYLGKDSLWGAAATAFCSLMLFSTALIDHVYWTPSTMESRFVLSHTHVQFFWLASFYYASQFYRCDEKKDLKVKYTILYHFVLSEFEFSVWD